MKNPEHKKQLPFLTVAAVRPKSSVTPAPPCAWIAKSSTRQSIFGAANLRDRRAVARYGGLTGSPDESGKKRREKGLARSGNARVRRGMIQLAWRFLMFQKGSALAHWFYARTKNAPQTRKTMIVALARKLLIALWRLAREGAIPEGIVLRPAL